MAFGRNPDGSKKRIRKTPISEMSPPQLASKVATQKNNSSDDEHGQDLAMSLKQSASSLTSNHTDNVGQSNRFFDAMKPSSTAPATVIATGILETGHSGELKLVVPADRTEADIQRMLEESHPPRNDELLRRRIRGKEAALIPGG